MSNTTRKQLDRLLEHFREARKHVRLARAAAREAGRLLDQLDRGDPDELLEFLELADEDIQEWLDEDELWRSDDEGDEEEFEDDED